MKQWYLLFDFETFSKCDLTKAGSWEYSCHESTEVICVAFQLATKRTLSTAPIILATPGDGNHWDGFLKLLSQPGLILVAHGVQFEYAIVRNTLKIQKAKDFNRWICTQSLCAALGLPRSLDSVGESLKLSEVKMKDARQTMLRLSKPALKKDPNSRVDPTIDELATLYSYCVQDVRTMSEILQRLPPLTPDEHQYWIQDQEINTRGFAVDELLVRNARAMVKTETERLDQAMVKLTKGELKSGRQPIAIKAWLAKRGVKVPNLKAETVQSLIADRPPSMGNEAYAALSIRQEISRSSTAKYNVFPQWTRSDNRARNTTIFCGAHTGRQTARGPQPHNLLKQVIPPEAVEKAVDLIRKGDHKRVRKMPFAPMNILASVMRSVIIPSEGQEFDIGDFGQIEMRVLLWLAQHHAAMKELETGVDQYVKTASKVYSVPSEKIIEGYRAGINKFFNMRQLGKCAVLGCGFGLGLNGIKFQSMAKEQYSQRIEISLAKVIVRAWRNENQPVVQFWDVIEQAAIRCVKFGKPVQHHGLVWSMETISGWRWLTVKLQSGRKLWYFNPSIHRKQTRYGESLELRYYGVDSKTQRFVSIGTWGGKLTENVVQALARDLMYHAVRTIHRLTKTKVVLLVHDEIVGERFKTEGSYREFENAMKVLPAWAKGLPIKVEGSSIPRYRKL